RPSGRLRSGSPLVDIRIGAEFLENLLALLLVDHEVHALFVVPAFHAVLGDFEQVVQFLPVLLLAGGADRLELIVPRLAQGFEQFIFQAKKELAASRVPLSAAAAGELAIDTSSVVSLSTENVQPAGIGNAGPKLNVR